MVEQKFLIYRFNSFIKKTEDGFRLRVNAKEYKVKNGKYTYNSVISIISRLQTPQKIQTLEEYTFDERAAISFLIKTESVLISEIAYYGTNTFKHLVKNYEDFNNIQLKLADLYITMNQYPNDSGEILKNIFEEKKTFYLDYNNSFRDQITILIIHSTDDAVRFSDKIEGFTNHLHIVMTTFLTKNYIAAVWNSKELTLILHKIIYEPNGRVVFDEKAIRFYMNYAFLLIIDSHSEKPNLKNIFTIENFQAKNFQMRGMEINADQFALSVDDVKSVLPQKDKLYCLNEFIKITKQLFDISFTYNFDKKSEKNVVSTQIIFHDLQIESTGENDSLMIAAEDSIKRGIIQLFSRKGIMVHPIIGQEEMAQYLSEHLSDSIKIFEDYGAFREAGLIVVGV